MTKPSVRWKKKMCENLFATDIKFIHRETLYPVNKFEIFSLDAPCFLKIFQRTNIFVTILNKNIMRKGFFENVILRIVEIAFYSTR